MPSSSVPCARRVQARGMACLRQGKYAQAMRLFCRHLAMPDSVWQEERCLSMRCLASCCVRMGNDAQAERWLLRACAETPHRPQPWAQTARYYRRQRRPDVAAVYAARAAELRVKTE